MVSPKKRTNKFAFSTQTAFHDAKRRLVKKDEFVRSFFGRILGAARLFWYKLTFSTDWNIPAKSKQESICLFWIQPIPIYKHSFVDGLGTKIQAWVIVRGGTMSWKGTNFSWKPSLFSALAFNHKTFLKTHTLRKFRKYFF